VTRGSGHRVTGFEARAGRLRERCEPPRNLVPCSVHVESDPSHRAAGASCFAGVRKSLSRDAGERGRGSGRNRPDAPQCGQASDSKTGIQLQPDSRASRERASHALPRGECPVLSGDGIYVALPVPGWSSPVGDRVPEKRNLVERICLETDQARTLPHAQDLTGTNQEITCRVDDPICGKGAGHEQFMASRRSERVEFSAL
jgi:hypothetical protein